jgi:four helix bundle protein
MSHAHWAILELGWYREPSPLCWDEGFLLGESMNGQTGKRANGQEARTEIGSEFRRLVLWQKAQNYAALVVPIVIKLPRDRAVDVIANQLLRATTSIPANIAEGYGRFSQAAYRNHLSIARGSAFEVESWIDLLQKGSYISAEQASTLFAGCTELQKLITLRMKSLVGGRTYAGRSQTESADES